MAQSIDKRVARLEGRDGRRPEGARGRCACASPSRPHCGRVVLEVAGLAKAYGGPPVFEDVGFDVGRGERLLVLGLNGAGKTSLLRILAGQSTQPTPARSSFGHDVVAGYYAQEHEGIDAGRDAARPHPRAGPPHARGRPAGPARHVRAHGREGVPGRGHPVGRREDEAGARPSWWPARHNLLLLDEPTNNLDPPCREAVADALAAWPGAMVIVSHDADVRASGSQPDRVLLMPDGDLDYWSDDLLDLVALA